METYGRRIFYATTLCCLFMFTLHDASSQNVEKFPNASRYDDFIPSFFSSENESTAEHAESLKESLPSVNLDQILSENSSMPIALEQNVTGSLLDAITNNVEEPSVQMKTTSFVNNNSFAEAIIERNNSSDSFTNASSSELKTAFDERENGTVWTTAASFLVPNDLVSNNVSFQNVSSIVPFTDRPINFTTPQVPVVTEDGRLNRALLSTLVAVAILCVASVCFIFGWRRWRSQLSGEWILNKNSFRPTSADGFENKCFTVDCKFSPVSCNMDDSSVRFARPVYDVSKVGHSSVAGDQTRLYDSRDQIEMMEIVQKANANENTDQ